MNVLFVALTVFFFITFSVLYRPLLYRMVVANKSYDAEEGFAREHEMYFTTSRRASPHTVRRTLARRGAQYFQQRIFRLHRQWIPMHRIRISFETEEQAEAVDRAIKVYGRTIRHCGKLHSATALPPREIPYAKRSRRAKTRKGKRP
jgi:uncharacterized protein with PIN domain